MTYKLTAAPDGEVQNYTIRYQQETGGSAQAIVKFIGNNADLGNLGAGDYDLFCTGDDLAGPEITLTLSDGAGKQITFLWVKPDYGPEPFTLPLA